MPESPAPIPAQTSEMSIDDLAVALGGAGVLDLVGLSHDDLLAEHGDMDLVETLRITHDLLIALRDSSVLDTFLRLPRADQENFLRWIGSTDDRGLRASRTDTFVSALKMSPLKASTEPPREWPMRPLQPEERPLGGSHGELRIDARAPLAVVITAQRVERRTARSDALIADQAMTDIAGLYSAGIDAERIAADLGRKEALRINDEVVQALVASLWAWELNDGAKAHAMVRAALASAKDIVDGFLDDLDRSGNLVPGAFRTLPTSTR
jgi:hypothetical protein